MSNEAHKIPGQSLYERLGARGARRPAVGVSPAFYERFALGDPWSFGERSGAPADGDMFSYLSAGAYYDRLRGGQDAPGRARSRLLGRLERAAQGGRASAARSRMLGATGAGSSWLRTSSLATMGVSRIVTLERHDLDPADLPEQEPIAHKRRPARKSSRRSVRPIERALQQAAPTSNGRVERALQEIALLARGQARGAVAHLADEIRSLPAQRQVEAARKALRQVRGGIGAVARVAMDEVAEDIQETQGSRALDVARARSATVVGASPAARGVAKGLRPVMSSSPSLAPLRFEQAPDPVPERPEQAVRRREAHRPARVVRQGAHRSAPAAAIVRQARTQQEAGRAGPSSSVARDIARTTAARPVPSRKHPTEWVARLAAGSERDASIEDVRYGMEALGSPRSSVAGPAGVRSALVPAPAAVVRSVVTPRAVQDAPAADTASAPRRSAVARLAARSVSVTRQGRIAQPATGYVSADTSAGMVRFDRTSREQAGLAPQRVAASERLMARLAPPSSASRAHLVATPPTSYVQPAQARPVEDESVDVSRRGEASRSAVRRERARPQPVTGQAAPARVAPARQVAPTRIAPAPQAAPKRASGGMRRAIERATPVARRDARGVEQLSQAPAGYLRREVPVSFSASASPPMERSAPSGLVARQERSASAPRPQVVAGRRQVVAPDSQVRGAGASTPTVASRVRVAAPELGSSSGAHTAPTLRASRRADEVHRVDARGGRVLSAWTTAHVRSSDAVERSSGAVERSSGAVERSSGAVRTLGGAPEMGVLRAPDVAMVQDEPASERPRRSGRAAASVEPQAARVRRATPVSRQPVTPSFRAASRDLVAQLPASARRGVLAPTPTAYVGARALPAPDVVRRSVVPGAVAAPTTRRAATSRAAATDAPTVRAAARDLVMPRIDARGRVLATSGGTDYLQAAERGGVRTTLSSSPVARLLQPAQVGSDDVAPRVEPTGRGTAAPARQRQVGARAQGAMIGWRAAGRPAPMGQAAAGERPSAGARIAARASSPALPWSAAPSFDVDAVNVDREEAARPLASVAQRASGADSGRAQGRRSMTAPVTLQTLAAPEGDVQQPSPAVSSGRRPSRSASRVDASRSGSAGSGVWARDAVGSVISARGLSSGAAAHATARLIQALSGGSRALQGGAVAADAAPHTAPVSRLASAGASASRRASAGAPASRRESAGVSASRLESAGAPVLRRAESRRSAVRPAMGHVGLGGDFRWLASDAPSPTAASEPVRSATPRRSSEGPVTRKQLDAVLREVSASVRASERAERPVALGGAARRSVEGAGVQVSAAPRLGRSDRGVYSRVARTIAASGVEVVLTGGGLSDETFAAGERLAGRSAPSSAAWAEGRSSVADRAGAAPGVRVVRRAFAGAEGLELRGLSQAASRMNEPVGERAVSRSRQVRAAGRTVRRSDGRFAPAGRAMDLRAADAVFAGLPGVDGPMPVVRGAAGVPIARTLARGAVDEVDAPARVGRGTRGVGAVRALQGGAAPVVRPFDRTLAYLGGPDGARPGEKISSDARRARRKQGRSATGGTRGASAAVEGSLLAQPAAEAGPGVGLARVRPPAEPSWARRAVSGSAAESPEGREGEDRALRAGGGGVLAALARADRPEDVVRVILERSDGMRSLSSALPAPAVRLVERIIRIQDESLLSARGERPSGSDATAEFGEVVGRSAASRRSNRASPTHKTLSRGSAGARSSDGVGSSQVMKLAGKLMKLIHLAEVERRVQDAQRHVRMAEDTAEARAEGRSGAGQAGQGSEAEGIQALQRDVLEAVLRELELNLMRNQGDPDGWW